jgi:citrate synthase
VRGRDLVADLIGSVDFVDMFMLVTNDRPCQGNEKAMINAILVTVTDHGLTPSAIAARMTFLGAPEAPQAAVAAGLLGAGSVFLGAMQNAAIMLQDAAGGLGPESTDRDIRVRAEELVAERRAAGLALYGFGHNIHVEGDPRVAALAAVAKKNGYFGHHWRLLLGIEAASVGAYSRRLPVNAAGATGAIILEMGLPLQLARGLALVGRCAGLVGHLIEEERTPIAADVWDLVLRQDPRNELLPMRRGRR